jgi:hypothetical protein
MSDVSQIGKDQIGSFDFYNREVKLRLGVVTAGRTTRDRPTARRRRAYFAGT